MNTKAFLELLQTHNSKSLSFEYSRGRTLQPGYHITEVKHLTVDSVDCGSRTDSWNETVIQLWENPIEPKSSMNMTALKALGILNKVGKMKPYRDNAILKFEYGNTDFHTAQLLVHSFEITDHELTVKLFPDQTDCKAKDECGIEQVLHSVKEEASCCASDSQCC